MVYSLIIKTIFRIPCRLKISRNFNPEKYHERMAKANHKVLMTAWRTWTDALFRNRGFLVRLKTSSISCNGQIGDAVVPARVGFISSFHLLIELTTLFPIMKRRRLLPWLPVTRCRTGRRSPETGKGVKISVTFSRGRSWMAGARRPSPLAGFTESGKKKRETPSGVSRPLSRKFATWLRRPSCATRSAGCRRT